MWHWLAHHLGTDDGNGGYYLFWSGSGADLAYIGAVATGFKVLNCHETGCWRIGTHVTLEDNGHRFRRCRRHHQERHDRP